MRHRPTLREWLSVAALCSSLDDYRRQISSLPVLLTIRFGRIPTDIAFLISETMDEAQLNRWKTAAWNATALAEFRAAAGI